MRAAVRAIGVAASGAALAFAVSAEAGSVRLDTAERVYDVGETVEITITNNLEETAWAISFPYLVIGHEATGEIVYTCVALPDIVPLPAGLTETAFWNQVSCTTGLPAPKGVYVAWVTWFSDSFPELRTSSVRFCIDAGCEPTGTGEGVSAEPWGRVKARWRGGGRSGPG